MPYSTLKLVQFVALTVTEIDVQPTGTPLLSIMGEIGDRRIPVGEHKGGAVPVVVTDTTFDGGEGGAVPDTATTSKSYAVPGLKFVTWPTNPVPPSVVP
jgi:hypothetical protein